MWVGLPSGGDHYGFALRGERLVDGEYRRLEMFEGEDGGVWGLSPTLNLEFHWVEGSLRLYDPAVGRWLPTHEESEERAEAAESERSEAEVRAESERVAREAAEARMAELEAALLRMSGGERE